MRDDQKGFTLIELMVVVAIIGILATVAYPSYIAYVQKGHQRDGQSAMLDLGAQLERYRARHFSYQGATISELRDNMENSEHYTYTLNITNANQRFEITATPKGSLMAGTEVMRLNERGETCWKKGGCVISTDATWQENP